MRQLLSGFVLLTLVSCSSAPRAPQGGGDFPEQIIDAHVHLHDVWSSGDLGDLEASRVRAVVAHSERGPVIPTARRNFPFTVRLCAGIDEQSVFNRVEDGLRTKQLGCLKIYLGYVKRWATDPLYLKYYKLAEKYAVPVVFHTGDTYDKMGHVKYADPLTLDEIAVGFPKLKIVIAHLGNPWFASAAEVAYKNDNVYLDTSALMLGDMTTKSPEAIQELLVKPLHWMFLFVENPKKFLFGTDWPLCKVGPYIDAVKLAIPREHWRAVFHDNAAEVFNLK